MFWLITQTSKGYEINKFKSSVEAKGWGFKVIELEKLIVSVINNQILFDYQGIELNKPDYALFWRGCKTSNLEAQLYNYLKGHSTVILNQVNESVLFSNKFNFLINNYQLQTIDSIKLRANQVISNINIIEKRLGYPVVLKSDIGSGGQGIYKLNNQIDLLALVENIDLLDSNYHFHLQKYIEYETDIRVYVVGGKRYFMKRENDQSFKANYFQGAQLSKYQSSLEIEQFVDKICQQFKSKILGIDLLIVGTEIYLTEINSAPGFKGIETVYEDLNIAKVIIEEFDAQNKRNRNFN